MIYLELFLTFLRIGAFSFGGGYGMISLIREETLSRGWLSEDALLNMIAVAESTPGPIAVNMATFVGSSQGGVLGSVVATLGVILPSFVIILLIAVALRSLLKHAGVKAFLGGVRPCVVGLILSTALIMLANRVVNVTDIFSTIPAVDLRAVAILAALAAISLIFRTFLKKTVPPILLIVISAGLGAWIYAL